MEAPRPPPRAGRAIAVSPSAPSNARGLSEGQERPHWGHPEPGVTQHSHTTLLEQQLEEAHDTISDLIRSRDQLLDQGAAEREAMKRAIAELTDRQVKQDAELMSLRRQAHNRDHGLSIQAPKKESLNLQPEEWQARGADLPTWIVQLQAERDELLESQKKLQDTCSSLTARLQALQSSTGNPGNEQEGMDSKLQQKQMEDALARVYKKLLHEKASYENVISHLQQQYLKRRKKMQEFSRQTQELKSIWQTLRSALAVAQDLQNSHGDLQPILSAAENQIGTLHSLTQSSRVSSRNSENSVSQALNALSKSDAVNLRSASPSSTQKDSPEAGGNLGIAGLFKQRIAQLKQEIDPGKAEKEAPLPLAEMPSVEVTGHRESHRCDALPAEPSHSIVKIQQEQGLCANAQAGEKTGLHKNLRFWEHHGLGGHGWAVCSDKGQPDDLENWYRLAPGTVVSTYIGMTADENCSCTLSIGQGEHGESFTLRLDRGASITGPKHQELRGIVQDMPEGDSDGALYMKGLLLSDWVHQSDESTDSSRGLSKPIQVQLETMLSSSATNLSLDLLSGTFPEIMGGCLISDTLHQRSLPCTLASMTKLSEDLGHVPSSGGGESRGDRRRIQVQIASPDFLPMSGTGSEPLLHSGMEVQSISAHSDAIWALATDNMGHVFSGSHDGVIKVWDPSTWSCIHECKAHSEAILALLYHDGMIISGSSDGIAKAFRINPWCQEAELVEHTERVGCLTTAGAKIATGSADDTIRIWSTADWKCEHLLKGHTDSVLVLTTVSDLLISGGCDQIICIWSTENWDCVRQLHGHLGSVLAFAHNGQQFFSAGDDCTVRIWDMSSWNCTGCQREHSDAVSLLAFSGNQLISTGDDNQICVWEVENGLQCAQKVQLQGPLASLLSIMPKSSESPSQLLALGSFEGTLSVWRVGNLGVSMGVSI